MQKVNPFLNDICVAAPACEQCKGKALPIQSSLQKWGSVTGRGTPLPAQHPRMGEKKPALHCHCDSHLCLTKTLRSRIPKQQLEPYLSDEDANRDDLSYQERILKTWGTCFLKRRAQR